MEKSTRYIKDPFSPYHHVNCAQTVLKLQNKFTRPAFEVTAEPKIVPTDFGNYISSVSQLILLGINEINKKASFSHLFFSLFLEKK